MPTILHPHVRHLKRTPSGLNPAATSSLLPNAQMIALPSASVDSQAQLAQAVAAGLQNTTPRTLPYIALYDAKGSELYEWITRLPEYYPTRRERQILHNIAPRLCQNWTPGKPIQLVELGSGSSSKTRILLNAFLKAGLPLHYVPIDISASMLTDTIQQLALEYPQLSITGLCGNYEEALATLPPHPQRLVAFLGGSIGNFTPEEQHQFFQNLHLRLSPGNPLLLGFDRQPHAHKSEATISLAYNDSLGVTARFNLNLLAHLNTVLGANFQLAHWKHLALYNPQAQQIEMYLVSQNRQTVDIPALQQQFEFQEGERLLSEISRKFDPMQLADSLEELGFGYHQHWSDPTEAFSVMQLIRT